MFGLSTEKLQIRVMAFWMASAARMADNCVWQGLLQPQRYSALLTASNSQARTRALGLDPCAQQTTVTDGPNRPRGANKMKPVQRAALPVALWCALQRERVKGDKMSCDSLRPLTFQPMSSNTCADVHQACTTQKDVLSSPLLALR